MTHTMISWGRITSYAAVLLLTITLFAVLYDPGPEITYFGEASTAEGLNWGMYRYDVRHQGIAPIDSTVDTGLEP